MEERIMSKLFISGGTVIDPETLTRFSADVLCEDGRIAAIYKEPANAPKDAQVLDASGCFVCPKTSRASSSPLAPCASSIFMWNASISARVCLSA